MMALVRIMAEVAALVIVALLPILFLCLGKFQILPLPWKIAFSIMAAGAVATARMGSLGEDEGVPPGTKTRITRLMATFRPLPMLGVNLHSQNGEPAMTERLDALTSLHTALIDSRKGYEAAVENADGKGLGPLFRDMITLRGAHADEVSGIYRSEIELLVRDQRGVLARIAAELAAADANILHVAMDTEAAEVATMRFTIPSFCSSSSWSSLK